MKKRIGLVLTVMAFCFSLTVPAAVPAHAQKKAKMNHSKITIAEGKTVKLKVLNQSGKAVWSTTKKKVATVSSKGVVSAKKQGTAVIKAKAGGKTYQCKVTVTSSKKAHSDVLHMTVNNEFFTRELYEKVKKIRWEVIDGTKPITDQYRIYKIYQILSSMKLEELPDDTPIFAGGIALSFVLKDGTKTSFALGQYLCINNKKYAISEQRKTVDKLGNLLRKYAL